MKSICNLFGSQIIGVEFDLKLYARVLIGEELRL